MATITQLFKLSLIPGAVLSRLTYRGYCEGGELSKLDALFMIVSSYAIYGVSAFFIIH